MKKSGILLVNIGSPKEPTKAETKKYLAKFLGDPRVIKTPRALWLPILHGIILNTRPAKSAKLYQSVWREDGGSPLMIYGRNQQENLQKLHPDKIVEIATSYSEPSIPDTLDKMLAQGVNDLTVIPMYPQYSGTTVGSVYDDVTRYFRKSDKIITVKFVHSFYENKQYIAHFVNRIKDRLEKENFDALLFSYHGIPVSYVEDGDTYPTECDETTKLIMAGVGDFPFYQTYQSKFGPSEWLTPATDATLKTLPKQGVKRILVIAPSFVADCLETLEELEVENKGYFMENGGAYFEYLPPFNEDMELAEIFSDLI